MRGVAFEDWKYQVSSEA